MKLIATNFHVHSAREFLETFSEVGKNNYYFFYGKSLPFEDDTSPPNVKDNINDLFVDLYTNMLGAKRMSDSDVSLMVPRYDWTSNTVYTAWRHNANSIFDEMFYVMVNEGGGVYSVFKCLDNNNNNPSTQSPSYSETSEDEDFYFTSDGYQWKYMYQFDTSTFNKFATSQYIPVVVDTAVSGNAIAGAIDVVEVTSGGSNYNSYTNGVFQQVSVGGNTRIHTIETYSSSNTNFYTGCAIKIVSGTGAGQLRDIVGYTTAGSVKRVIIDTPFSPAPTVSSGYEITPSVSVSGDGSGFLGRALVNATSNTIHSIEIVNRGSNYHWATAVVTGNTGIINVSSNSAISANNAELEVVISPPNGHGYDPVVELGGKYVCFSVTLDKAVGGIKIEDANDFRQIGLIKDPLLANVEVSLASVTSGFVVDDMVSQSNTEATGKVTFANSTFLRLTNVKGVFESGNSTYGIVSKNSNTSVNSAVSSVTTPTTYVNQTLILTIEKTSVTDFTLDEDIQQDSSVIPATANFYYANTTVLDIMKLTNVRGTFNVSDDVTGDEQTVVGMTSGATAKVTGKILPDFVTSSGEPLYVENITPINRSNGQVETVRVILEF